MLSKKKALDEAERIMESAASQGRLNPDAQDELEARLAELRRKVNPTAEWIEDWWYWGVGAGIATVLTASLLSDQSQDQIG